MNRNESFRLGDLQAEGNLGNERNRNSESKDDRMRNRSSEGTMRERSRESEDRESSEDWSPAHDNDVHDNNDARRGGER